jgi:N-acetylmuramoyl-L-alanine amidase
MLCAPCGNDDDCLEDGARCLDHGNAGRFCGAHCGEDAPCPAGSACDPDEAQCIPEAGLGTCSCPERAVLLGSSTSCARESAAGRCAGSRSCGADGLTDCDAPEPVAEVCNGVDDDCDGTTDGMNRPCSTACGEGTERCELGSWVDCDAETPQCESGACCDGCRFRSTDTRCDDTPVDLRSTCDGGCGGQVRSELAYRHCTGDSGACGDGNLRWEDQGVQQVCGDSALCVEDAGTAGCVTCDGPCVGGACSDEARQVVCLDPGFGGDSPGPSANGIVGKDATLAIALALRARLDADTADPSAGAAWDVLMTRTGDVNPDEAARAAACDGAELILSIRVNACCGDIATGVESYYGDAADETWAARVTAWVSTEMGMSARSTQQSNNFGLASFSLVAPAAATFLGFVDNSADAAKIADTAGMAAALEGAIFEELGIAP